MTTHPTEPADAGETIRQLRTELHRSYVVIDAYEELIAVVRGECPSILNEDSGASAVLIDLTIAADAICAAMKGPTP